MNTSADRVREFLDRWDARPQYTEDIYGLGDETTVWLNTSDLRSLLDELVWLRDRNPLDVERYRILEFLRAAAAVRERNEAGR